MGNPFSCLWILCIQGSLSPKSLMCRSDPFAASAPSLLQNSGDNNNYYYSVNNANEVNNGSQSVNISYSIASPWITPAGGGGTILSGVWRNQTNASLPLMCDIAPLNNDNNRSFVAANANNPKALNSNNHSGGEGQEVGFGDCHVEWCRTPAVGPNNDFIFTFVAVAPNLTWGGTQPTGTTAIAPADPLNDVVMIPCRDGSGIFH